jgi:hypothetical protein
MMDKFIEQIELMCHCVGFEPTKTRKNQRKHECYRNYFNGQNDLLDELVKDGYVVRYETKFGKSCVSYSVTEKGLKLLSEVYKIVFEVRR